MDPVPTTAREAILPGIRAALSSVLEETMRDVSMHGDSNGWVGEQSGIVDWSVVPSAPVRETLENQALAHLSARLDAYLSSGGAIEEDSADEDDGCEVGGDNEEVMGEDGEDAEDDTGRRAPWEDCVQGILQFV